MIGRGGVLEASVAHHGRYQPIAAEHSTHRSLTWPYAHDPDRDAFAEGPTCTRQIVGARFQVHLVVLAAELQLALPQALNQVDAFVEQLGAQATVGRFASGAKRGVDGAEADGENGPPIRELDRKSVV